MPFSRLAQSIARLSRSYSKTNMELATALLVYILTLIFVLIIARLAGIRTWSAVALALLLAFIVLLLIQPLSLDTILNTSTNYILLYSFIVFLTFVLLFVYILDKTLSDRDYHHRHHNGCGHSMQPTAMIASYNN